MDDRDFDRVTRLIGSAFARRAGLRGLVAMAVAALTGPARFTALPTTTEAKARRRRVRAEACIPTGKPCPSKKPRGHNKHGKARALSCNRCCQKHTAVVNGETQCACQPNGESCAFTTECCLGVCTNGVCIATTPSPPPPPPPPALCPAGANYCTNADALCPPGSSECFCMPRQDGSGPACVANTPPPGGSDGCNCTSDAACEALAPGSICASVTSTSGDCVLLGFFCSGVTSICLTPCSLGA